MFVGSVIHRISPPAYWSLRSRWHADLRQVRRLARLANYQVMSGPFAGMKYPIPCLFPFASSGGVLQKLLGCYEFECAAFIDGVLSRGPGYRRIINIGAGEGYYAVGLAMRIPTGNIVAYEANDDNRSLCARLGESNAVGERVKTLGLCTVDSLRALLPPEAFIMCDCEGNELELLNPDAIPNLASAEILVELHDVFNPIISGIICDRFARTHRIEIASARSQARAVDPVALARYPFLADLSPEDQEAFVTETRPPGMKWAFLRPL